MKTLMLHEEIKDIMPEYIKLALKMMDLAENAPYRKDSMIAYLTKIGKDPKFYTLFEALGVKVKHTEPVRHPTYRFATFEDVEHLWKVKALTKFVSQTHIFDDPGRPATYAIFQNRCDAIENTALLNDYCIWQKQYKKLQDLAATAYWNSANFDTHYDRIDWARNLLKPIECWQILVLGKKGQPINERLDAEDATYDATVDFWRGMLDPAYFSFVGREVFSMKKLSNEHMCYNYVDMAVPKRENYAKFIVRTSKEEIMLGKRSLTLETLYETSDIPSCEADFCSAFEALAEEAKESLIKTKQRIIGTIGNKIVTSIGEVVPTVFYNIPYPLHFLAGLLDLVDIRPSHGVTIEPTGVSVLLEDKLKAFSFVGTDYNVPDSILKIPEGPRSVLKDITMYSSYSSPRDKFSKQEVTLINSISSMMKDVYEWMNTEVPSRMELVMHVYKDPSITEEALANCGIRFDAPEYDIHVSAMSLPKINSKFYDTTTDWNIPSENWVNGLFAAATMFFKLTTPLKPFAEPQFPRSTKWHGNAVYQSNEFIAVSSGVAKDLSRTFQSVNKDSTAYTVHTPIFVSTEAFYAPDNHMILLQNNALRSFCDSYKRIENQEERKYLRRKFLKILFDIGQTVKQRVGLEAHSSLNPNIVLFHNLIANLGYAAWYYNFVFSADLQKKASEIFADITMKDYYHWVDVLS